eukprot:TRINITY_DN15657_c0_g1_i1.p1 TRINITY_DN15657_c0_g1~~TRINITY_DN15657_c0_g1_i1.p1  ORF type:complete len:172 (-),score=36.26 TRINITY_DN15657_c0_g1_i1:96-611(-)
MVRKDSKKPTHPKYQNMISQAILHYKERSGSSVPAISKFIKGNFDVPEHTFSTQLKLALKRLIEANKLIQPVGTRKYRLSPEFRKEIQKELKAKEPRSPSPAVSRSKSRSKSRSRSRSRSRTPAKKTSVPEKKKKVSSKKAREERAKARASKKGDKAGAKKDKSSKKSKNK